MKAPILVWRKVSNQLKLWSLVQWISCLCLERDRQRETKKTKRKGELESVRRALPESDKTCMYNPAAVNAAAALSARQTGRVHTAASP